MLKRIIVKNKALTTIICFLVFFLALLLRQYIIQSNDSASIWGPPPTCDKNDITHFTLSQINGDKKDSNTFRRTNPIKKNIPDSARDLSAAWEFIEPDLGEADAQVLQRLVGSICSLPLGRAIPSRDKKKLGLDNPRIKGSLQKPQPDDLPQVWHFQVGGKYTSRTVAIFLKKNDGSSAVYEAPLGLEKLLQSNTQRFLNRRVMRMPLGNVNYVNVQFAKRKGFTLERGSLDWKMLVEGETVAAPSDEIRRFVNRLGTLRALDILKKSVTEKKCRKLADAAIVQIEGIGNHKETLYFSEPQDLANKKRKRMLTCNSQRKSLLGVHKDMWMYLNTL